MNLASLLFVTLVLAFVVVPSACHFGKLTESSVRTVIQPDVELSIDCRNQSYDFISGVASLGVAAQDEVRPNFVFTLGLSPFLYAASFFGSFPAIPLWSNTTANQVSMGAQLRGAVMKGNSLFVVFSRNEVGPVDSNILQIDDPWGIPTFQVHPLGDVIIYDVVSTTEAIYILTRPKHTTELYNQVLRFDVARTFLTGVRLLNVTGGKMALSADQKFLIVASTRQSCASTIGHGGCTMLFNLDSMYLRPVWSQSEDSGGCAVNALATTPDNKLYLANSGRKDCMITRLPGPFDSQSWTPQGSAQENWNSVSWAAAGPIANQVLEGYGGVISIYPGTHTFVLQSGAALNFASPMLITDVSLGRHLVFTAPGCSDGTLSAYAFRFDQFQTS